MTPAPSDAASNSVAAQCQVRPLLHASSAEVSKIETDPGGPMRAASVFALSSLFLLITSAPARAEDGPDRSSCIAACGAQAEQAYHACREAGGGEGDCAASAVQGLQTCVAACPDAPPACTDLCTSVAADVADECNT